MVCMLSKVTLSREALLALNLKELHPKLRVNSYPASNIPRCGSATLAREQQLHHCHINKMRVWAYRCCCISTVQHSLVGGEQK
jgi:hypothetical protein